MACYNNRREFLKRAALLPLGGVSAQLVAAAPALPPQRQGWPSDL